MSHRPYGGLWLMAFFGARFPGTRALPLARLLIMQVPVQITFRDMPVSDAAESACWDEAAKLERFYDRITSCRVVIAESHHRHQKGNLFGVRIDLAVPGRTIVVNREPPRHHQSEQLSVAIHEAFDAAQRQIEDYARRQRGQVKS